MSRTLDEWLSHIEKMHPSEIELGLERIQTVAKRLYSRTELGTVITVGGTNGKGSTVTLLERMHRALGLNTGQYTSPHIHTFNERILINGQVVDDQTLIEAFEAIERLQDDVTLTYFEYTTLAALYIFAKKKLDVVVLEVGLGGRLDAVNIVDPDVSVITSVGLDHQEWLGETVEEIGYEKAGIFRSNTPAVVGEIDVPQSMLDYAIDLNSPLYVKTNQKSGCPEASECFSYSLASPVGWDWKGVDRFGNPIELTGLPMPKLPVTNAATAIQAFLLSPAVSAYSSLTEDERGRINGDWFVEHLRGVLTDTTMKGRLELGQFADRHFLFDVAHNAQAAGQLVKEVQSRYPDTVVDPTTPSTTDSTAETNKQNVVAVLGMLVDKKPSDVIDVANTLVSHWILVDLEGARGQTAQQLAEKAAIELRGKSVFTEQSMLAAIRKAVDLSNPSDLILVFGSFFTVAAAQEVLNNQAY